MGKKNNNKHKKALKRKEKKAEAIEQKFLDSIKVKYNALPPILGGEFNYQANNIDKIEEEIKKALEDKDLNPTGYKKRILFISEASYLRTGFSTYLREVLKHLQSTGRFEVAEFGSYGNSGKIDPRARQIPWKYYHNLPEDSIQAQQYGMVNNQIVNDNYKDNQFGKWRLTYVLADFKPDIVICNRDNWMDTHVLKNALRKNCLVYWMPTVDGYPQKWEWIKDYSEVDKLLTYSWFGKKVLETQSRVGLAKMRQLKPLNVSEVCQPGVNIDIFKPRSKSEVHQFFGMNNLPFRFVGTVMRNQPRKLFTRIIESFRIFKENYPRESENVKLLLHTSIPDVGWDIPECVAQNGLYEEVVYTFLCSACGQLAIGNFPDSGIPADCPKCGTHKTFQTPNTQMGVNEDQFTYIFNLMSVYIQGSIAEGDGMPVNEAKACGVPVLASDYSALYEKARNGGAMPIKNLSEDDELASYTEHETGQHRSLFDRKDLAYKLAMLMGDEKKRSRLGNKARECAEQYYSWELCGKKWELEILNTKIKDRASTWEGEIETKQPSKESPPETNDDEEWLNWIYRNILCTGKDADPAGLQYWTRVLNSKPDKKAIKNELEKYFRDRVGQDSVTKEIINNPELAFNNPIKATQSKVEQYD